MPWLEREGDLGRGPVARRDLWGRSWAEKLPWLEREGDLGRGPVARRDLWGRSWAEKLPWLERENDLGRGPVARRDLWGRSWPRNCPGSSRSTIWAGARSPGGTAKAPKPPNRPKPLKRLTEFYI